MRIVIVEPAFDYSTVTVAEGYWKALKQLGFEVARYCTYPVYRDLMRMAKDSTNKYRVDDITEMAYAPLIDLVIAENIQVVIAVHGWHFNLNVVNSLRAIGCKLGLILTDEPQQVDVSKQWSSFYDYVFSNDRNTVAQHKNCHYLPVAADDEIFFKREVEDKYKSDIVCAGSFYPERISFLEHESIYKTLKKYNVKFAGSRRLDFNREEMNSWFMEKKIDIVTMSNYLTGSKISIDIPRDEFRDGIFGQANTGKIKASCLSPRIFECALAGTMCLTSNSRKDLFDLYPTIEIPTYHDQESCANIIDDYMHNADKRDMLVMDMFRYTHEHHRYINRAKTLVEIMGLKVGRTVNVKQVAVGNFNATARWNGNWEENVVEISKRGLYKLENSIAKLPKPHRKLPVYLVSNGSSLKGYLKQISEDNIANNIDIIAVNQACVVLEQNNITYKYAVIIHPDQDVYYKSVAKLKSTKGITLLASTVVHWKVVEEWLNKGGTVKFFKTGDDGAKKTVDQYQEFPNLGAGVSVIYNALACAEYLKYSPVHLFGFDLCYLNGERYMDQPLNYEHIYKVPVEIVPTKDGKAVITTHTMIETLKCVLQFMKINQHVEYYVHGNGILMGDLPNLHSVDGSF